MTINDILDAIDHALDDYEVSADAMRWAPESVVEPQSLGLTLPPDATPYSVPDWVQGFLEAINRDIHDLAVISFRRYREPGQEWWEWWGDAAT